MLPYAGAEELCGSDHVSGSNRGLAGLDKQGWRRCLYSMRSYLQVYFRDRI